VLIWIDNIDCPMGCDLLERWPSLEQLQRINPAKLRDFFTTHNCRSAQRIQERIDSIYQAIPAVQDTALLEAGPASAQALAQIIQALNSAIADFDHRIESGANNHPEAPLFIGLPGAGPALRPRLIAAFGTQRQRYQNAGEVQSYAGIAPVTERSGGSQWIHFRRACPRFLRQPFTSSPATLSASPLGLAPTIEASGISASLTMPRSGPWLSNGFAFYMPAGGTVNPTMRQPMLAAWKSGIPRWPS